MEMHAAASRHVTHEAERVPRSGILLITFVTLVFAGSLCAISVALWNLRTRQPVDQARELGRPGAVVSNVRTDVFPRQGDDRGRLPGAGEALRTQQREALQRFEWTDASRANVRIPIDVAIELELREQR